MPSKKIIKLQKTDIVETISPYDFAVSLTDLQSLINVWITKYGEHASIDFDRYGNDPYSDSSSFNIQVIREETDIEFELRMSEEISRKKINEERERQEFERLRSKFEKK